jgi:hypothetical protein
MSGVLPIVFSLTARGAQLAARLFLVSLGFQLGCMPEPVPLQTPNTEPPPAKAAMSKSAFEYPPTRREPIVEKMHGVDVAEKSQAGD